MPYDRTRAVQYAAAWWNSFNPQFSAFQDDCTNFISQCLWAGGMPMEATGRRDKGWWYQGPNENWSYSWAVAHSLRWYLEVSGRAMLRKAATDLEVGDLIGYDWDGDNTWQHNTIVVGFDPAGEPLVAAHTVAAWARPWSYKDSPGHTAKTQYIFLHMNLP